MDISKDDYHAILKFYKVTNKYDDNEVKNVAEELLETKLCPCITNKSKCRNKGSRQNFVRSRKKTLRKKIKD